MYRGRPPSFVPLIVSVLLVGFIVFWFSDTIADNDLWGHIRFGQDILRTGSIGQTDVYSYRTAGQRWINHEWLAEVVFASVYDHWGPTGLIVFKVSSSLVILGLCYAHLRRHGLGPYRCLFVLVVVSVPFRMGLGTVRPQVFTYILFLFELLLIREAGAGHQSGLWLSPILVTAWVNLHGGVLAGVGILGIWIAVQIIGQLMHGTSPRPLRLASLARIALLGLACGCALLLNPYGAALVDFLVRTAMVPRPEISEWSPLAILSFPGVLYLGLLTIGFVGLALSARRRSPESILIYSTAAVLPLVSERHYPLFALALVVLMGEHVADVWNRWRSPQVHTSTNMRLVAVISLFLSLALVVLSLPRFGCVRIEPFYFPFPARAVAFLRQSGLRGNMAVPFDWGEYALWHLGPEMKVSIDGRRETLYSDEAYRQSRDFELGTGPWDALLKTSATDLVLAKVGSPTAKLVSRTDGWLALYHDSICVLFVRAGLPSIDRVAQCPIPALPDNGDGLCFPGPTGWLAKGTDRSHISLN